MKNERDELTIARQQAARDHYDGDESEFCYALIENDLDDLNKASGMKFQRVDQSYKDDCKVELVFSVDGDFYAVDYSNNSYEEEYQYEGIFHYWERVIPVQKTVTVYE